MSVEDVVSIVVQNVRTTATRLSAQVGFSAPLVDVIASGVAEVIRSESSSIRRVVETEGIDRDKLDKAVEKLISTSIAHAQKEGRREIRLGDVMLSLIELKWTIFPFCRPSQSPPPAPPPPPPPTQVAG